MQTVTDDVTKLMTELAAARSAFESAEQRTAVARREETAALNRLNAAQRAIDQWYRSQRNSAPRDSDWKMKRGVPVEG